MDCKWIGSQHVIHFYIIWTWTSASFYLLDDCRLPFILFLGALCLRFSLFCAFTYLYSAGGGNVHVWCKCTTSSCAAACDFSGPDTWSLHVSRFSATAAQTQWGSFPLWMCESATTYKNTCCNSLSASEWEGSYNCRTANLKKDVLLVLFAQFQVPVPFEGIQTTLFSGNPEFIFCEPSSLSSRSLSDLLPSQF